MKKYKYLLLISLPAILFGCSVTYKQKPIQGLNPQQKVCIINNPRTRAGFETAIVEWLRERNYQTKILSSNSNINTCKWTLTYYGRWSWDIATYLSDANIKAYHNGKYAGEAKFHVQGTNMNLNPEKYGTGRKRIREMMNRLFGESF